MAGGGVMRAFLHGKRLRFVWLGTGKLHVIDTEHPNYDSHTMCGKAHDALDVLANDSISHAKICGRCLASLRTYRRTLVEFEEA